MRKENEENYSNWEENKPEKPWIERIKGRRGAWYEGVGAPEPGEYEEWKEEYKEWLEKKPEKPLLISQVVINLRNILKKQDLQDKAEEDARKMIDRP